MRLFEVIQEDAELLVVNKPAGLVCHPTKTDEFSSLISRVRLYLGKESRPHLVNRLDRETSGVTVIAKTDDAALQLRRTWESRNVEKEYLAIVHGHVDDKHRMIEAPLGKDQNSRVAIKDCVRADGSPANTAFWVQAHFGRPIPVSVLERQSPANYQPFSLLRVQPRTGRKHQIRIHLAHIGHPIVGDKLYGGDEDLYMALVENRLGEEQKRRLMLPYHALHAKRLRFEWQGKEMVFEAEPENWFREFLTADQA